MSGIHNLGSFGHVPYMSEDLAKQARLADIKSKPARLAYLMAVGKNAKKPKVKEGIHEARGALKWIASILEEEEK